MKLRQHKRQVQAKLWHWVLTREQRQLQAFSRSAMAAFAQAFTPAMAELSTATVDSPSPGMLYGRLPQFSPWVGARVVQ
jgi:hypothetical protein